MKGDALPKSDSVSRYCAPKTLDAGELQASAFMLRRQKGETYLSVNWLEYLSQGHISQQITAVRRVFKQKFTRVPTTAQFAVLNVGRSQDHVADAAGHQLETLHEPEADDDSHSGIFGIAADDEFIAELLLEVVTSLHPAK